MNPLKINITGVRGIVGETLTPHLIVQFTQAFGAYAGGGRIYICNDARRSAAMVRSAVISGLLATGCEPVDFGVCPTPSMQYAAANSDAAGAIAISAGHNSEDWNALRFIRFDGMYLNAQQGDELLDVYNAGEFPKAQWDGIKKLEKCEKPFGEHIAAIIKAFDAKAIKKRKFTVAVDTCNGACSEAVASLLDALGCKAILLHNQPGRGFPHNPEPSADSMQPLAAIVKALGADAGFMFDSAGERLGIVSDDGTPLPEERTLPLCAAMQMKAQPGTIVTNLSTTRAVDDIAAAAGAKVIRTPIGQAFVAEAAMKNGAVIAGEGSGGVIVSAVQNNNDSLATMAFILHNLAAGRQKLSAIVKSLPQYSMKKKRVSLPSTRIYSAIQRARNDAEKVLPGAKITLVDGVKADWPDSWLHIRPSNTESLIRIIAEAKTPGRAEKLIETGCGLID